jgi:hypothetical protein
MPSTVYKGDLAEVTFGHETGIVLTRGAWGALTWTHTTTGDISKITFTGGAERLVSSKPCSMFDASSQLKYPTGMLAGTSLRFIGGGAFSADDHQTSGRQYRVVDNRANYIEVTPALKTTAATNATAGDEIIIGTLGTPTIDVGMTYNASADASDETVLTDQFIGLAASVTLPETKMEVMRQHVVGIGRDVVVQEPQHFKNDGGTIETAMHSARWFYYALGNEALHAPSNVADTINAAHAKVIAMGDTYVEFTTAVGADLDDVIPGDYIVVVDDAVVEVLTPMDNDPGSGQRTIFGTNGNETQFDASRRNEIRRVVAVDNTDGYERIYVDDPFNFDHASGSDIKRIKADDSSNSESTDGCPSFVTTPASYGNILNRQKRAIWSMWQQPSFSLETSIRTRNVESYGTGGYAGSQTSNVPGTATDSKQLTRVYKGCKVKNWSLNADADSQVKMKVDFDALLCYTDTGRLEDSVKATATLTALSQTAGQANTRVLTLSDGTNSVNFSIDNSTATSTATVIGFSNANSNANQFATNIAAAVNAAKTAGTLNMSASASNAAVTLTQDDAGAAGNTTPSGTAISDNVITLAAAFLGGVAKADRFTAHRMFENIANGPKERKVSGIAPNTEKPFFYYNGTITGFGTTIAQVTNFSLTGNNNVRTVLTVGANPGKESRNAAGQSLQQIPFAGSRNPSLSVEGKVDYELSMDIIPTDPLLWHEYRTARTHGSDEPIKLHLVKNGAGDNREEVTIVIDDYIIQNASLQIPEDKTQIKFPMTIYPKHVKVVAYDTLFHA